MSSFNPRLVHPIADLIGGFFSPYQSPSKPTPWTIPACHRWQLTQVIRLIVVLNHLHLYENKKFFPSKFQHWFSCPQVTPLPVITMWFTDWVTGFCAVSPFLENPEASEHEHRSVLLLIFMHIFKSPVTFWICHKTKSRSFAFSFL